ncbi:MAG: type IV pilus biogenesis/stability protein PilW [Burkholderiaceae bacterium]|nr:type IV pilus biogenesis/stability protein PilW [Burkholderiaceae bacterium]
MTLARLGCSAGWPVAALAVLAAALLAGCASSTSSTSGPPTLAAEPFKVSAPSSDPSEVERRARVRLELASAYFSRGQLDTALDEVKLSIAAKPDLAEAYNLRGLIYAAMNEDRLAEESFARALQLNPNDGAARHNQAWYLCLRNRFAESQAQFSAALAIPQYREVARTQLARGVCYGRNGQWAEAEAALMRAYELDPANPSTGINLAEVLYQRGDFERARFYIGRVNDTPANVNAQSLWLALRIERRLGQESSARVLGERLRQGFPQSPEAALYERGRFDG